MKQPYLFITYPKCSTCQKAKRFLTAHNIPFEERHIVENTPTSAELKSWIQRSELPLLKLFNTNGQVYRSLNLKERMKTMSEDDIYACLASNGMLIKRPLLINDKGMLVGFHEQQWLAFCESDQCQ